MRYGRGANRVRRADKRARQTMGGLRAPSDYDGTACSCPKCVGTYQGVPIVRAAPRPKRKGARHG
jgi:hypothetical protein